MLTKTVFCSLLALLFLAGGCEKQTVFDNHVTGVSSQPIIQGDLLHQSQNPALKAVGAIWNTKENKLRCTGTLIAPDRVLTAAHCVFEESGSLTQTNRLEFRIGDSAKKPDRHYAIDKFSLPKPGDYVFKGVLWDLAVIHLKAKPPVKPIPIVPNKMWMFYDPLVVGYGFSEGNIECLDGKPLTKEGDRRGAYMKILGLCAYEDVGDPKTCNSCSIMNAWDCPYKGGVYYLGKSVTAMLLNHHIQHVCKGDSGGPLLIENNGEYNIIGVLRASNDHNGCCNTSGWATILDVKSYRDWVNQFIECPPDNPACKNMDLKAESTYGDYLLKAITMHGAPAGNYTFHVANPQAGVVDLRRNGVKVMSLSYNWKTTISNDNPYVFSFAGYFDISVAKAGSGTMNLYQLNKTIFDGKHMLQLKDSAPLITAGTTYGSYAVKEITKHGAPAGDYSFHIGDPQAGVVQLRRNGSNVMLLQYNWGAVISYNNPYVFSFAGYFDISVGKAGSGTMNLYGIDKSIFDGKHVIRY